ncbi:SgcJ/EcaC family oxidoreductase [Sphaerisporangium sp. NPDC088356]|uniref:SgcJ/EcaC family oxidoreductase n=1 Tax=Sphaerisporangium sp. NPDC088356 TaxID=3154871 RepID=UPI0034184822
MDIHRCKVRSIRLALLGGLAMALTGAAAPPDAVTPAADAAAPARSGIQGKDHTDTDLTALRRIWEQQADAWARGDAGAYARSYTTDADLINIRGEHLHSRDTIATRIQHYFNNQLKNTHILRMVEEVRFVSPTMAIILREDCVLYGAETACRPDTRSINTSLAVKHSGRWMVTSFHNTLMRRQDAPFPSFRNFSGN